MDDDEAAMTVYGPLRPASASAIHALTLACDSDR